MEKATSQDTGGTQTLTPSLEEVQAVVWRLLDSVTAEFARRGAPMPLDLSAACSAAQKWLLDHET
jgi:hypothetical protein